jgi:hypothetical protein
LLIGSVRSEESMPYHSRITDGYIYEYGFELAEGNANIRWLKFLNFESVHSVSVQLLHRSDFRSDRPLTMIMPPPDPPHGRWNRKAGEQNYRDDRESASETPCAFERRRLRFPDVVFAMRMDRRRFDGGAPAYLSELLTRNQQIWMGWASSSTEPSACSCVFLASHFPNQRKTRHGTSLDAHDRTG